MKSCRFGLVLSLAFSALTPLAAQTPRDPTLPLVSPLESTGRSVICGTTILSGNAAVDPTIAKRLPPGNFTMLIAQPKMCRDNGPLASNASQLPAAGKPSDFLNRLPTFLGPKR
jgi:hypothetical protein